MGFVDWRGRGTTEGFDPEVGCRRIAPWSLDSHFVVYIFRRGLSDFYVSTFRVVGFIRRTISLIKIFLKILHTFTATDNTLRSFRGLESKSLLCRSCR